MEDKEQEAPSSSPSEPIKFLRISRGCTECQEKMILVCRHRAHFLPYFQAPKDQKLKILYEAINPPIGLEEFEIKIPDDDNQ